MNMSSFTWIPFYTELAGKLLQYKTRREDLAKLIYSNFEKKEIKFLHDYDGSDFKELDPFTVYSIFNRSMKNRIELTQRIKELFGLKAMAPDDFDGIPVQSPMNASYITYSEDRSPDGKDVDRLWKLFEQAQDEKSNLSKVFDAVLKQRSIAIPKLTMGLYYICPNRFLALDGNNRDYLEQYGFDDWDFLHLKYSDYSDLLVLVREKMKKKEIMETSFPEFSANAYAGRDAIIDNNSNPFQVYINLLEANHNLILTGAPGTGKTYLAKQIAQKMIFGEVKDQLTEEEQTQFNEQCGFVQFHPSYDYTDFVEGLRPIESGNGFNRRNGIFKDFCADALQNLIDSKKTLQALKQETSVRGVLDDFLEESIEQESTYYTSGTKNEFHIVENKERSIIIEVPANEKVKTLALPKSDLITLMENEVEITGGKDIQQYFHRKYRTQQDSYTYVLYGLVRKQKAKKNEVVVSLIPEKKFVFIIDEINRGEISKIFGELFFSIDPGYRGEKGMVQTQYQNMIEEGDIFKKGFYVPENVYIIGTMNDIDRSVESMDFAMRRRFAWKEVTAEESYEAMKGKMTDPEKVRQRMFALNDEIAKTPGLNKSYQIGAAYFLKLDEYGGDFDKLWEYHLKGLLYEYLRGNRDADEQLKKLESAYKGISESTDE